MKSFLHKPAAVMVGLTLFTPVLHASPILNNGFDSGTGAPPPKDAPPVAEKVVRYTNKQYGFQLNPNEFRYAFEDADGKPVANSHPESELLIGLISGGTPTVSPALSTVIDELKGNLLRATVTCSSAG